MKPNHLFLRIAVAALLFGAVRAWSEDAPPGVSLSQKPKWVSTAAAGLTLTRGNSETLLATISGSTDVKWDQNEWSFGADGTYGETKQPGSGEATKNAEQIHGVSQYNRMFSDRVFGFVRAEGLHDGLADIRYRTTINLGAGYYFIKNKTADLSAELGPGYLAEELGDAQTSYATFRFGEKFHCKLSDRSRLWQTVELLPQVDDFNNYIVNAEIGIEADLSQNKRFSLRSFLQDTYNNVPAVGRERNDAKLVTAIACKF
jgi:putative salt-induced outer membrane protein YdiY